MGCDGWWLLHCAWVGIPATAIIPVLFIALARVVKKDRDRIYGKGD